MPWIYPENVPAVAENWSAEEQRQCVEAANAALEETGSEEQAIFACIRAAGKGAGQMQTKVYRGRLEFKADKTGEFLARFATLNVIDHQGDVTVPGAFETGQATLIEAWNHSWGQLPVGKAEIREEDDEALAEGVFFLDTMGGQEHYRTIKNLGDMQEWSYTFDILESGNGDFEGQQVRFLKRLDVIGVAPVDRGAGINTGTVMIKSGASPATHLIGVKEVGLKPYPNEHACRLRPPSDFEAGSFRRVAREHEGKEYAVIMGRLEGEDVMTEQAYRYSIDDWEAAQARSHCADHDGTFEPAEPPKGAKYTVEEREALRERFYGNSARGEVLRE